MRRVKIGGAKERNVGVELQRIDNSKRLMKRAVFESKAHRKPERHNIISATARFNGIFQELF